METVLIAVYCYPTTFPHVAATVEAFIVSWEECFFPVDTSACPVLSTIVSQLFALSDSLLYL